MTAGAIYRRSREAVSEIARSASPVDLETTVPETPAWTVREVVGHLVGGAEDHLAGEDGDAPSEAWTARHVARLAPLPVEEVVARWEAVGPRLEGWIDAEPHRWTFSVIDAWVHEHDVRSVLGLERRDDPEAAAFAVGTVWAVERRCERDGLPTPSFVVDGAVVLGGEGPTVTFPDLHEVGRVLFGRRSEAQVRSLGWSEAPDRWLPHLSFFPYQPVDAFG